MTKLPVKRSLVYNAIREAAWDFLTGRFSTRFWLSITGLLALLFSAALSFPPVYAISIAVIGVLIWRPRSFFKRRRSQRKRYYDDQWG